MRQKQRQPCELLDRISHTLIGHSSAYLNTPWGEAALLAYDEIQPLREAVNPALAKLRRRHGQV